MGWARKKREDDRVEREGREKEESEGRKGEEKRNKTVRW